MDSVFTYSLYGVAVVLLGISFAKDRKKTALSLRRAWSMFASVLPQFMAILLLTGLLLALVSPETIQRIIGAESGFVGMLIASLLGAVTLIPVFIAFPIAAELLKNGAGITQIAVFISTLTMVRFGLNIVVVFAIAFIIEKLLSGADKEKLHFLISSASLVACGSVGFSALI